MNNGVLIGLRIEFKNFTFFEFLFGGGITYRF